MSVADRQALTLNSNEMTLPTLARLSSRTLSITGSQITRSLRPIQAARLYSSESEIASLTDGEKHIFNKLTKELSPLRLRVADVSGNNRIKQWSYFLIFPLANVQFLGGCGSMYAIDIASDQFKGLSVVKQHRKINEILKEEIKEMHGLQVN